MTEHSLQTLAEELRKHFSDQLPEMLTTLRELVDLESFSFEGAHVDAVGAWVAQWLDDAGFQARKLERLPSEDPLMKGLGHVVTARSHPREQGSGIAVIAHMDTVFPGGTLEKRPFRIEGDFAYGPGVADMKGGITIALYVARFLKEKGLLRIPLTLLFSPEEELCSPEVYPLFKRELADAKAVFSVEPGFSGGGVTVERFGCGDLRLYVTGKASHAARDYRSGASATLELAKQMLRIDRFVKADEGIIVNTGKMQGGESSCTVAGHAESEVFISFKTLEDGRRLLSDLRETVAEAQTPGTKCRLQGDIGLYPMYETEGTKRLFSMAAQAGECIGSPLYANRTNGSSDAGYCSTMLGIPTLCSMGPEGTGLHSEAEQLDITTIVPRAVILALSILQAQEL